MSGFKIDPLFADELSDDNVRKLAHFFLDLLKSRQVRGIYLGRTCEPRTRWQKHQHAPPIEAQLQGLGGPDAGIIYFVTKRLDAVKFYEKQSQEILMGLAARRPEWCRKVMNSAIDSRGRRGEGPHWAIYVLVWFA